MFLCNLILAETKTLIDFTALTADYPSDNPKHNKRTALNFKSAAGVGYTEEEKNAMLISLGLDAWKVELASSSRTTGRMMYSFTKEAKTANNAPPLNLDGTEEDMQGRTILGVRIMFPESSFNSYAIVKPPFDIQAYQDKEIIGDDGNPVLAGEDKGKSDMFDGFGVLKNTGIIKSISVTVYGANFPHNLEIILENENFEQKNYHICYLDYEGWQQHTWNNPNYIADVRNRELKRYPLYPKEMPYTKLVGFIVYRDAAAIGGDFIVYFKDVKLTYDLAVKTLLNPEIEDEKMWGILAARSESRKKAEYKRLGARQVLEMIEEAKQDKVE